MAPQARPWLKSIIALQTITCVFRVYPVNDFFGGFAMATMVALGLLAMCKDMDIQLLCYYGLSCLVNGVFDALACLSRANSDEFLFSTQQWQVRNMESLVIILAPWSSFLGTYVTWHLRKHHIDLFP